MKDHKYLLTGEKIRYICPFEKDKVHFLWDYPCLCELQREADKEDRYNRFEMLEEEILLFFDEEMFYEED